MKIYGLLIFIFWINFNLFSQDNIERNLNNSIYLFENKSLFIDYFFANQMDSIFSEKNKNQLIINGKVYFCVQKYAQNNKNNSTLFLIYEKENRSFLLIDPVLGFKTENYILLAKFSQIQEVYNPNYPCVIDEYGNYCLFSSFLGGTISKVNQYREELNNNSLSWKIMNLDQQVPSVFEFLKNETSIYNGSNVIIYQLKQNNFIPITLFFNDSEGWLNADKINLDSTFLLSVYNKEKDKIYLKCFEVIEEPCLVSVKYFDLFVDKNDVVEYVYQGIIKYDLNGIVYH